MRTEPLTGRVVGNYEVREELGRGGMGVVYNAHERSLHRPVALKVLPEHLARNSSFVQRFMREARTAAQLTHPNIVPIYAVGEDRGVHYIAMEFVRGVDLASYIRGKDRIPLREALDIARQAASALAEAHRHGIVHRDIKPHNIMIDDGGHVKVMDFGMAKHLQSNTGLTAEGTMLGTPAYMSPEQIKAGPLDGRSDIYSLGITLYEMLTGHPPFEAETPLSIMHQITHDPFPDLRRILPDVPEEVIAMIERMVAREVQARYASADEIVADCTALMPPEPPAPRRPSTIRRRDIDPHAGMEQYANAEPPPGVSRAYEAEPAGGFDAYRDRAPQDEPAPESPGQEEPPTPAKRDVLDGVLTLLAVLLLIGGVAGVPLFQRWRGTRPPAVRQREPLPANDQGAVEMPPTPPASLDALIGTVVEPSFALRAASLPFAPGASWVYETTRGGQVTFEIADVAVHDGDTCYRMEFTVDEKPVRRYFVAKNDGLYAYAELADKFPLYYIELPLSAGMEWEKMVQAGNGTTLERYKAVSEELIALPAGEFRAVHVRSARYDLWFAPDYGLVQFIDRGGIPSFGKLAAFRPAQR